MQAYGNKHMNMYDIPTAYIIYLAKNHPSEYS